MIYTHALAALIALAVGFTGAWKVQGWRWRAADAERIQAEQTERDRAAVRADTAAEGNATRTAAIRTQIRTVTREVDRVVLQPTFIDRPCLDADSVRLVAQAAGAASSPDSGQPAPALPGSAAAP